MADLLSAQTGEICYISIEDVRDSLKGVFLANATTPITDTEIEGFILEAQKQVNSYLHEINPDISCDGIVNENDSQISDCGCSELDIITDCADVPLNIKRATLQLVDTVYTDSLTGITTTLTGNTLNPGDLIREKTACGVELEYYVGNTDSTVNEDIDPCILVDCATRKLLACYEKKAGKMGRCKPACCKPTKCCK